MTYRMFAASIVVLGIGLMAAPVETSAGSGGAIGAPISTHLSLPHGMIHGIPAHMKGFRMSGHRDHRHPGFPMWSGYGPNFPNYDSAEYVAPQQEPRYASPTTENFSERARPAVIHAPDCHTDTQTVPSEKGGEKTINITRC